MFTHLIFIEYCVMGPSILRLITGADIVLVSLCYQLFRLAWRDLLSVWKRWYVLAFCVWIPDRRCEENARRAYWGNGPAVRRRHSRPQSGICLRFYAAQDKLRELSGCLPLLPNVSSGHWACELDGHGRGGVTSLCREWTRCWRRNRSAALARPHWARGGCSQRLAEPKWT